MSEWDELRRWWMWKKVFIPAIILITMAYGIMFLISYVITKIVPLFS